MSESQAEEILQSWIKSHEVLEAKCAAEHIDRATVREMIVRAVREGWSHCGDSEDGDQERAEAIADRILADAPGVEEK